MNLSHPHQVVRGSSVRGSLFLIIVFRVTYSLFLSKDPGIAQSMQQSKVRRNGRCFNENGLTDLVLMVGAFRAGLRVK